MHSPQNRTLYHIINSRKELLSLNLSPFQTGYPFYGYYANSADPGRALQNAASDQGLHCLLTDFFMKNTMQ